MGQLLSSPQFDEYGLLKNPEEWSSELACEIAHLEGIEDLSEVQWEFINTLRNYYQEFHVPPPATRVSHDLHLESWAEHHLFPSWLVAWRIAGLPDPGEEAKAYMSAE